MCGHDSTGLAPFLSLLYKLCRVLSLLQGNDASRSLDTTLKATAIRRIHVVQTAMDAEGWKNPPDT